jgi:hypothetical protein
MVHTRTTRCYIPEDRNIHNYCCGNFNPTYLLINHKVTTINWTLTFITTFFNHYMSIGQLGL